MPSLERVWLSSQDECGSRLLVGRLQVHASPIFNVANTIPEFGAVD